MRLPDTQIAKPPEVVRAGDGDSTAKPPMLLELDSFLLDWPGFICDPVTSGKTPSGVPRHPAGKFALKR